MTKVSPIDLVFYAYRDLYKLTTEQYDLVLEKCTDDEVDALLIDKKSSFQEKRKALTIIKKYI